MSGAVRMWWRFGALILRTNEEEWSRRRKEGKDGGEGLGGKQWKGWRPKVEDNKLILLFFDSAENEEIGVESLEKPERDSPWF